MNSYEKRKLKSNIYRHANAILYGVIFVIAGIITIAAAANRADKVAYVDESRIASSDKEAVDINDSKTNKVAVTEQDTMSETAVFDEKETISEQNTEVPVESATQEQTISKKVKVITDTLYVRSEAASDAEIIGMVEMDEVIDVVSQNGEWLEISFDGTKGYISSEYTQPAE